MRILSVHIDGFGKFEDREIVFGRAANVIRGQNEAGKSTLHSFIEAMLLGPNRKPKGFTRSVYEAMEPWDENVPYKGSMIIEYEGANYRIERNFANGQESLSVICEENGLLKEEPEEFLKTVMEDLTPEACRNSISIGQLSAKTGAALQRELSSYIANVGSTANPELNAGRAIEYLEKKKEELRTQIRDDAAREYAASLSRIKNIESDLNRPENENRIRFFEEKRDDVLVRISVKKEELAKTEGRIDEAGRILAENRIREREDVTAMEQKAESLYAQYKESLGRKRNGFRIAGMIISGLLMAAAATGLVFPNILPVERLYLIAAAGLFTVVLLILILSQCIANRKFREAEKALKEYMTPRIGAQEVGEQSMKELKKQIHGWDGLLDRRDADLEALRVLKEQMKELEEQETDTGRSLRQQNSVLIQVEEKLSEANNLRSRAAQLRSRIAENNRIKEQIDAIDIAIDTISDLSDSIKGRLGTYLNNEASRALRDITNGHYHSMDIGSGNDMLLNSSEGMISVNDVSAGTIDQIYLAVRLAAARFMMKNKDSLPLIFDDSFALYDDDRLKSAVNFVVHDYKGQIFIFTCHHREEAALIDKANCRLVEL